MDAEMRFSSGNGDGGEHAPGVGEEEARRAARLSFGGVEQTKEDYRDIALYQRRDHRYVPALPAVRRRAG